MITGRAVSALLLHRYRRVVVRRAVNYDFAGALPEVSHTRRPCGQPKREQTRRAPRPSLARHRPYRKCLVAQKDAVGPSGAGPRRASEMGRIRR